MTEQTQPAPHPNGPTDASSAVVFEAPPTPTPATPSEKAEVAKGGKDAVLADLARERDKRQALEQRFTDQQDAFAKALGLKPEETSDTEKLTSQLSLLQEQILTSERRALAAEHKIPEQYQHLLTATDSEGLKRQAQELVEFAQAAHYAALTTAPAAPPAFQQNPGQGQGGSPMTPEAQALAEYEKFYPPIAPRR